MGNQKLISVLAGNPILRSTPGEELVMEPQLRAFEVAVKRVQKLCADIRNQVQLFIAVDHIGKDFCADEYFNEEGRKLGKRRKSRPTMDVLDPRFTSSYAELSESLGFSLSDAVVIPESKSRLKTRQELEALLNRGDLISPAIFRFDKEPGKKPIINCVGISVGTVKLLSERRVSKKQNVSVDEIEMYWEGGPRCRPMDFEKAIEIAIRELKIRAQITNVMVGKKDELDISVFNE